MKCPGCGTAELLNGRSVCQACGLLRILHRLPAPPSAQPARPHARARRARKPAPQPGEPTLF